MKVVYSIEVFILQISSYLPFYNMNIQLLGIWIRTKISIYANQLKKGMVNIANAKSTFKIYKYNLIEPFVF